MEGGGRRVEGEGRRVGRGDWRKEGGGVVGEGG